VARTKVWVSQHGGGRIDSGSYTGTTVSGVQGANHADLGDVSFLVNGTILRTLGGMTATAWVYEDSLLPLALPPLWWEISFPNAKADSETGEDLSDVPLISGILQPGTPMSAFVAAEVDANILSWPWVDPAGQASGAGRRVINGMDAPGDPAFFPNFGGFGYLEPTTYSLNYGWYARILVELAD
jgi:hypothetical protein